MVAPVVASGAAAARQQQGDELKQKVERLIDRLDADTRKERVLAERQLLELGPDCLPLLPPPDLLPSVSAREAVRRIRLALERRRAVESVRPSQITLRGAFTLSKILKAVEEQTGNAIDASRLPDRARETRLEVGYEQAAFWPVMDNLSQRAGFSLTGQSGTEALRLIERQGGAGPEAAVAYSGAFRIAALPASVRALPGDGEFRILRVGYRVTAEPRLRPLFVRYRGRDFSLQTAAGRKLDPFSPDARPEIPLGEGGRHLKLQADFKLPADLKPRAVRLAGKLTVTTAADSEEIAFERLSEAEGVSRRQGGVTVKLMKVDFRDTASRRPQPAGRRPKADASGSPRSTARFRVAVAYDFGGPAFESHRLWIFHNRVYLEAKDGRRIERDGAYHTALEGDGAVAVEYGFSDVPGDPDDYRFVYVAPTLIIDVPIEFRVSDIPVSATPKERKQP